MAVEAQCLNIFPTQIFGNRELNMMMNGVGRSSIGNACSNYSTPLTNGVLSSTAVEMVIPAYNISASNDGVPVINAPLQSDSGLTYAAAVPASRKRPREELAGDHLMTPLPILNNVLNHHRNDAIATDRCGGSYTFLGEDISPYLLQQQSDINRFIAQHNEKVRSEFHERRNRYSRAISATVEESIMKKLKAIEEEIERIGELNSLLEDRVKSLCIENQIWRDLAHSNEATANALRSNLEEVLAQVQNDQPQVQHKQLEPLADDAQSSCCGSNNHNDDELTSQLKDHNNSINARMCRSCGREESCVLILPCRHLCVCAACSSSVHTCPVCRSTKTRSLHVYLSS